MRNIESCNNADAIVSDMRIVIRLATLVCLVPDGSVLHFRPARRTIVYLLPQYQQAFCYSPFRKTLPIESGDRNRL